MMQTDTKVGARSGIAVVVKEFGPVDSVVIETRQAADVGADEVLIETTHAGVNFPDRLVIEGTYQVRPQLPFTPGKECVGRVIETGRNDSGLAAGDRVIARVEYGAWQQFVAVRAVCCSVIPDGIDSIQAMALGLTYQTAWFALHDRAHFEAGQTVFVSGAAGGVGLAAVELVSALGGVAIAGVRHPEQHDLVRDHGASHVVDLSDPDLRNSLKASVMKITDNRGVDIVLDNVGDPVFSASLRGLAWCGHVVVIGFAAGEIPTIKTGLLLVKNITVAGLQWSDYRDREPHKVDEVQQNLWRLCEDRKLRPPVMDVFPLENAPQALDRLSQGKLAGQILLDTTA